MFWSLSWSVLPLANYLFGNVLHVINYVICPKWCEKLTKCLCEQHFWWCRATKVVHRESHACAMCFWNETRAYTASANGTAYLLLEQLITQMFTLLKKRNGDTKSMPGLRMSQPGMELTDLCRPLETAKSLPSPQKENNSLIRECWNICSMGMVQPNLTGTDESDSGLLDCAMSSEEIQDRRSIHKSSNQKYSTWTLVLPFSFDHVP